MSASAPPPAARAIRLLRSQYEDATEAVDAAFMEMYRQGDLIKELELHLEQARSYYGMAEQTRDTHMARKEELRAALEGLGIKDL